MPTSPYYVGSKRIPSVSEILSHDPTGAEIILWAKRKAAYDLKNGKGAWDKMVKHSQDRGTSLHSMAIDSVLLNGVDPDQIYCPEFNDDGTINDQYLYWEGNNRNGLKYWLKDLVKEPFELVCAERPFVHSELLYGGTPDIVLKGMGGRMLGNITWLVDLKTFKGYETCYPVSKVKMKSIAKYLGITEAEFNPSLTYRYYSSTIEWNAKDKCWMNRTPHHQYTRYRNKKRNETAPAFKGWNWYSDKVRKAFMQCILYRELLSHNGIDTQNIRIVSASMKAGVQEFDLMDKKVTRDGSKLVQVFTDARDEAFGKLKAYYENESPSEEAA